MKFNHTNTMKDNDKPEAPEGYTAMLGKDVPRNAPADGLMAWCGRTWVPTGYSAQSFYRGLHYPEAWFAVPVVRDDKPEAPEGYTAMLGKDVPFLRPAGTRKWRDPNSPEDVKMGSGWGCSCDTGIPVGVRQHDCWFAVPNAGRHVDPKASQVIQKPQLQLIPPALNDETAKALMRGAEKYGFFNWRENKVEMMTYLGAMKRHIDCLIEGEDIDPDTGAHHLGCVAAGCGIVLDARKHGTLVDNRPPRGQNTL